VTVTQFPKKWFSIKADSFVLDGNSKAIVEVVCDPLEVGSHSESLKIKTSFHRCELSLVLAAKCIAGMSQKGNRKAVKEKVRKIIHYYICCLLTAGYGYTCQIYFSVI